IRCSVMISRDPEGTVYAQVARDLRKQIQQLAPGAQLRSEKALAHDYGVGIATVRRALRLLRDEGLVVGSPGQVARVAERSPRRVQIVPRGGSNGPSRLATPEECREMGLSEGAEVTPMRDADGRVVEWFPARSTMFVPHVDGKVSELANPFHVNPSTG